MPYHHGDLRRTLIAAAASAIAEAGTAKLSLRALAKRAGVSNAAPTYHFGDKAGLLTALASEGFDLLAEAMTPSGGRANLIEMGVSYVEFALAHPSHFTVMFQPSLYREGDPELRAAQSRARAALAAGIADDPRHTGDDADEDAQISAWSLMHGYATLVLSGAIDAEDPTGTARRIASHLAVGGQ